MNYNFIVAKIGQGCKRPAVNTGSKNLKYEAKKIRT